MATKKDETVLETPTNNMFEQALQFTQSTTDINDGLIDAIINGQNLKVEMLNKYMSNQEEKTEVSISERKIIPLCEILALNPFNDIADDVTKNNGKHLTQSEKDKYKEEFQVPFLSYFLDRFKVLGIPLKRKGRLEEMEVLKSFLMGEEMNIKTQNNQGNFK